LEGQEEAAEACLWGQIADYSTLLAMEEDHQALGMILHLDLLDQECSLQRMDQDQATCIPSSLGLIRLEAKEALLILSVEAQAEVGSMIHLVDQEEEMEIKEEEAASVDQAEAAWAVDSVVLEEASVEAVASEVVVDLVVLEETYLETINIIDLNKNSMMDIK